MNRFGGISRRGFLSGVTALTAAGVSAKKTKPLKEVRLAAIGVMGIGKGTTEALVKSGAKLVALCDIDASHLEKASKIWPGLPCYRDYREMLKEMEDGIDAVNISTPDSTHAYIAIECMNLGKHVYVQKPLARTFEECEMLRAAAERTGVVCQMGNQHHPGVHSFAILRDEKLWGDVKHIDSWSDRPIWPQGMKEYPKKQAWNESIDAKSWDVWCGPCANRGYSSSFHSFKWRGWWDYGCGAIGDMAVHWFDSSFWAFDLGYPVEIEGDTCGEGPVTIAFPKKSIVKMKFANGITFTWYDGGNKPAVPKGANKALTFGTNGIVVHGTKITTLGTPPNVIAAGDHEFNEETKKEARKVRAALKKFKNYSHYKEFVDACLAGDPSMCGSKFSYAAPFTQTLLLGCIALRFPGKKLKFDPETKQFTNSPEANKFLLAPNRGDWQFSKIRDGRPWWKFW